MIVQCPYCATRYQVDESRFASANPMLKCSRCRHVFPAPGSRKPSAAAKTRKTAPPPEESLTLPFEKTSWKDDREPAPASADAREGFVLGTEEADVEVDGVADDDPEAAEAEPEIAGDQAEQGQADELLPDLSFDEEGDDVQPRAAAARERRAVRLVLLSLLLVVLAYAILARTLFASPALARQLLGSLPLIDTLAHGRRLAADMSLVGVHGSFQRLKNGKEVFVVSGDVVSVAPVTVSSVEVRGRLHDADGKVLAEKKIYCGNVVSTKILGDLTAREISVLQKLAPPRQFAIRPGDSAGFAIVFVDPPAGAVEFTAQVVDARV